MWLTIFCWSIWNVLSFCELKFIILMQNMSLFLGKIRFNGKIISSNCTLRQQCKRSHSKTNESTSVEQTTFTTWGDATDFQYQLTIICTQWRSSIRNINSICSTNIWFFAICIIHPACNIYKLYYIITLSIIIAKLTTLFNFIQYLLIKKIVIL